MQKKKIQIKISTDHKISQDRFFSQRHSRGASRFFFLKGDAAGSNSRSLQLFFFISTMYVQLKKLMASKYSSSVCGGYMCVSNLNTKVWGFCFLSSCVFSLFVWLSECSCGQTGLLFFFSPPPPRMISNAPTLPKSEGAATLRKSYIWKWEIYKASLLLFSLQCLYLCFKN